MPQRMAVRFGNVCLCQNTQRERKQSAKGKKKSAKKAKKSHNNKKKPQKEQNTLINFSGRTTPNSELDSENLCSSNTQIHKQIITIGTASKLETILKVQKAHGANRHDKPSAREEGDIKIRN